jgi:hypothetical protein
MVRVDPSGAEPPLSIVAEDVGALILSRIAGPGVKVPPVADELFPS